MSVRGKHRKLGYPHRAHRSRKNRKNRTGVMGKRVQLFGDAKYMRRHRLEELKVKELEKELEKEAEILT